MLGTLINLTILNGSEEVPDQRWLKFGKFKRTCTMVAMSQRGKRVVTGRKLGEATEEFVTTRLSGHFGQVC